MQSDKQLLNKLCLARTYLREIDPFLLMGKDEDLVSLVCTVEQVVFILDVLFLENYIKKED